MSDITAELVDLSDLGTPIATCTNTRQRGWSETLNDTGSATITFQNDDPDLALIVTPNTLVNYYINGTPTFTMILDTYKSTVVYRNEKGSYVTEWKGPGHLALLDRALIYPTLQLGTRPIEEDRGFNWMANIYDWVGHGAVAATTVDTLANAQAGSFGSNWDPDMLDASTEVLGPTGATTSSAPIGNWYFNQVVTISADGNYQVQVLCDDIADVQFDGAHLMSPGQETTDAAWVKMTTANLFLSAGIHSFNARVHNAFAPTGLAFTVAAVNSDGTLGTVAATSQAAAGALVIDYPAIEPGSTPGEAIIMIVNEAKSGTVLGNLAGIDRADGDPLAAINLITLMFDGVNDSNGTPWPMTGAFSTKIGGTILTWLREMAAAGYIDFWMAPGTLDLYVYIGGTRGTASGVDFHPPTDIDDETTGNLSEQHETSEA